MLFKGIQLPIMCVTHADAQSTLSPVSSAAVAGLSKGIFKALCLTPPPHRHHIIYTHNTQEINKRRSS